MLTVVIQNAVMLNSTMPSVFMLTVVILNEGMLKFIMLSVVILSVVAQVLPCIDVQYDVTFQQPQSPTVDVRADVNDVVDKSL
jgi:hypothetical protein